MVLRAHLTRSGYDVTATERAATAMLRNEDYHLVVSDLRMPVVGGMELLNHCNETYLAFP